MNPPTFLAPSLLVALGGGAGAWLRYLTSRAWSAALGPVAAGAFPWATLTVNLVGSLAMGLLVGWLAQYGSGGAGTGSEGWGLLLGTGVLGGFTTFSAFSLELARFVERGDLMLAAAYAALSLAGGVAGLFLGLAATRSPA